MKKLQYKKNPLPLTLFYLVLCAQCSDGGRIYTPVTGKAGQVHPLCRLFQKQDMDRFLYNTMHTMSSWRLVRK